MFRSSCRVQSVLVDSPVSLSGSQGVISLDPSVPDSPFPSSSFSSATSSSASAPARGRRAAAAGGGGGVGKKGRKKKAEKRTRAVDEEKDGLDLLNGEAGLGV